MFPQPSREDRPVSPRLADQLRGVRQRDVVQLDVLTRRDVPLAQRDVLLDHVGERVDLVRVDAAEWQLHADHLTLGLTLAVDALLEAEADELVLGDVAGEEATGLGVEVVELALEHLDHLARSVEQLRICQRAPAPARRASGWLMAPWFVVALAEWPGSRVGGRTRKYSES